MTGLGGRMHSILGPESDTGGGVGGPVAVGARGDLVAIHVEELQSGMEGFANEQLERALGGFELVAFILHLLDALEQLAAGVFPEAAGEAVLLELVHDIAATREGA